ncbi:hypothetical protein JTE90_011143, partial [Oedothorax gibbosus]
MKMGDSDVDTRKHVQKIFPHPQRWGTNRCFSASAKGISRTSREFYESHGIFPKREKDD